MGDFKKRNYFKNKYHHTQAQKRNHLRLEIGSKGFLCTCNFQEKNCIREAYNLLNEYTDKLYGTIENVTANDKINDSSESLDVSDLLQKEIADLKSNKGKANRFQSKDTSVANCVFIESNVDDPVYIAHHIAEDIAKNKIQKTRYLLRLIPIELSCTIKLKDILENASKLFDKYFIGEPTTFCIVINKHHNQSPKDILIKELADLVVSKNSNHKVNLENPKFTIIIELIKGICLISVVPDYFQLKKYNLLELCSISNEEKSLKTNEFSDNIKEDLLDS